MKNQPSLKKLFILPIILSMICLALYCCPLYLLESGGHSIYSNVFLCLDGKYIGILITSVVLFILTIGISLYCLFCKELKRFALMTSLILHLFTIVFCVLAFVFAGYSTNLPKWEWKWNYIEWEKSINL